MATTVSPSATRFSRATSNLREGWCRILRRRNNSLQSPHIEHAAGDDEHRRHRQHLRERFRGRPFGGFLHVYLPRLGRDSSWRAKARSDDRIGYSEHPATTVRPLMSPHSGEYRQSHGRTVLRREFGSRVAVFCARRGTFGLEFARPLEAIELAGDFGRLRDGIRTEGAGAGKRRRTIGKIRIIHVGIGEFSFALVPPFIALVDERI